jgi:CubicO group peptidase (beta-lactamase class C family)
VPAFSAAAEIITRAIGESVFPGAVIEVGTTAGVVWQAAYGGLTYDPDAQAASLETLYDLASLTKVISTTTIAMRLVEDGRLRLTDRLARYLPEWQGRDRSAVTVRHLLAHSAGLAAWRPLFQTCAGRDQFQSAICRLRLDYLPGTSALYSDLGFILLGFLLADAGSAPLDAQFDRIYRGLAHDSASALADSTGAAARPSPLHLGFLPPAAWSQWVAPTEVDPWRGRLLVGEVHDENCWALGGAAGHAGLFGTAPGVGAFARALLSARLGRGGPLARSGTLEVFTTKQPDPGSSRALGWDTMLPTSSCGTRMSAAAFGHTGFTGTSLWLDPAAGLYVVLLSNRIHPTRSGDSIGRVRSAVHDAVMEGFRAA